MEWLSRRTDAVIAAYLAFVGGLVVLRRGDVPAWGELVGWHLAALLGLYGARFVSSRSPAPLRFLRDWYPVLAFPILYQEVELLASAIGNWGLTEPLRALEVSLFAGHPSVYLAERFAWVPLSEYLHFCYLSYVLLVPVIGGIWYVRGPRRAFAELVFLVSVTFAVSYTFYILFPVDSPFYLEPPPGAPLAGKPFYEAVHFVSSRGGARGGAFPSSHVSVSTVVLLVTWRYRPRWLYGLGPIYVGLVAATVYGRFHYAVDVFAGWALALALIAPFRWKSPGDSGPPPA